jgi:3-phosphoshikimate 1-carboxyvinyltransferase
MATGLRRLGARIEETADGVVRTGTGGAPLPGESGIPTIAAELDHRIAMSFAIAGLASRDGVRIDDMTPVATSFPGFAALLTGLGASTF